MGYKGARVARLTPFQKVLSIIGAILCVTFGFMLTCNLTIIVKGSLFPEKPPSVLGITPMVVLSGSMSGEAEDHIEVGDLIFVGKAEPQELETGDIIAFMQGKTVVTHRIISIETGEEGKLLFSTQGDANETPDQQQVSEDNLVGIYKTRIPKVGDFILFMQTPMGMLIFIGAPLATFIVYDIIRRQKQNAKMQKRHEELREQLNKLQAMSQSEE